VMAGRTLWRRIAPQLALIVLLIATASCTQARPAPARQRILFIGNSYTYVNDLPAVLQQLANASAPGSLEARMVVEGGATLQQHWEKGDALKAIREGGWTWVVLQEQSTLGPSPIVDGVIQVNDPENFTAYARRFDAEIRKAGAKTVLFLTWARRDAPANQAKLTEAYSRAAQEVGAMLAPVGPAWQNALHDSRLPLLHQPDGSHPTAAGTYLAACVVYATLFGRTPEGLPPVNVDPEQARLLQRVAWSSVREPARR
jgi:hypothetical protein